MPRSGPAPKKPLFTDPAEAANKKILAARESRIRDKEKAEAAEMDLGLDLKHELTPPPASASEFLADEWDKKVFGAPAKTTTRVVFGPDPIVDKCPAFHERLEQWGLEAIAQSFYELIMKQGAEAAPDSIMRKGLRGSIAKFGKEATANAFRERILKIPVRTVEIELDELDPLLTNPLREAVARYGRPGMAVKFLSDRCMDVLGRRGYEIVKDESGDPVKVGTLFMGLIPEYMAERRRRHFAEESESALKEQEAAYFENAARTIHDSRVSGVAPLAPGDMVRSSSDINSDWNDETRGVGIVSGR